MLPVGRAPCKIVMSGTVYPTLYIESATNELRYPPCYGHRLAVSLQRARTTGYPVTLRIRVGAGHHARSKKSGAELRAEVLNLKSGQSRLKGVK